MARGTRHVTTFALMAALGVFAAVGCGGSSVARDDSGGNDAGQASGGVEADGGTGGSPTMGGSPSNGGVPATGGVGAVSGTAGAAGEPSFCSLPAETGACRGSMERYAFDPTTGLCRPFVYGGCGGNANNFETAQSCYAACGASSERDPARCESPLECTLMPNLCCGACEPPTLMNRVAVRTNQVGAVNQAMSCHLVDCVPCDGVSESPWLGATCSENHCVSFDARTTELVTCEQDDDCVLRAGIGCCEDCSAGRNDFVALSREADIRPLTCGNEPVGCDDCLPVPPVDLIAVCDNGRCATAILAID